MLTKYFRKETIKLLFLFFFLCSSCKENQNNKNESNKEVTSPRVGEKFRILEGDRYLDFKLPDTIALKDTIKGYIVYKSQFDTLKEITGRTHFVNLYFANTIKISKDFEEFESKELSTFARIHDSLFIIYDISFKKRGNHLLEGYIKDYLYEDLGSDSVRYRSVENHILYQVYVE